MSRWIDVALTVAVPRRAMPTPADLPVCFPHRPCTDYPPLEADVINAYLAVGPVGAVIVAVLVVLLVGVIVAVLVLRHRARRGTGR